MPAATRSAPGPADARERQEGSQIQVGERPRDRGREGHDRRDRADREGPGVSTYRHVIRIREHATVPKPGEFETKTYAPGVGVITEANGGVGLVGCSG